MIDYTLITTPKQSSMTFAGDEGLHTVTDEHPHFEKIKELATIPSVSEHEEQTRLTEMVKLVETSTHHSVANAMAELNEHISYDGGQICFDGEPLHSTIMEHINQALIEKVRDWKPLAAFLEKLHKNPSQAARDHLMAWIKRETLKLTEEGDLIAYKGLDADGLEWVPTDIFVGNTRVHRSIPHPLGQVIAVSRNGTEDGHGLTVEPQHWALTRATGQLATVTINPADVGTTPRTTDFHSRPVYKYRVAALEVLDRGVFSTRIRTTSQAAPRV